MPKCWTLLALTLCLSLSLATGLVWEVQNDEGVSFSVAVGELALDGAPDAKPRSPDEVYAMLDGAGELTPAGVLEALRNPDQMTHPPGFYLGLHGWSAVAGTRVLPQRAPAYLAGLLSVLAMGVLARRLIGSPGAAAAAMVLLAVSPWFHGVSNFLRPYAPALCLGLWATVALASARPGPLRAGWRVAFVLFSAAGLYVVYHGAFVLLWHGVALLVLALRAGPGRRVPELLRLAAMAAGVALLYAPWVPTLIEHMSVTGDGGYFWKDPTAYAEPWPRLARLLQRFALGEVQAGWGRELFVPALSLLGGATLLAALWPSRRAPGETGAPGETSETSAPGATSATSAPGAPGAPGAPSATGTTRDARADAAPSSAPVPTRAPAAAVVWATAPVYPALLVAADLSRGAATAFITKYAFMLLPLLILVVVRAGTRAGAGRLGRLLVPAWALLLLAATLTGVAMRASLDSDHQVVAGVVRAGDAPDQLLLLSSLESRFAAPLVVTLREAGVARSRVGWSTGEQLPARVARALADPELRRLVLARFDGTTPRNPNITTHAYEETWTPEVLERVLAAARLAGWQVRRAPASAGVEALLETPPEEGASAARSLVLIDGARTKRFHGNY